MLASFLLTFFLIRTDTKGWFIFYRLSVISSWFCSALLWLTFLCATVDNAEWCRSWLIDSRGLAKKVINAGLPAACQIKDCGANTRCPSCDHLMDNSDVRSFIFPIHQFVCVVFICQSCMEMSWLYANQRDWVSWLILVDFIRMAWPSCWCKIWSIRCGAVRSFGCKTRCGEIGAPLIHWWIHPNFGWWRGDMLHSSRKSSWLVRHLIFHYNLVTFVYPL